MKARRAWSLLAALGAAFPARAEPSAPASPALRVFDGRGAPLEPATDRVSFSRALPPELGGVPGADEAALRLVVISLPDALPPPVGVVTLDARGAPLDAIVSVPTVPAACPAGTASQLVCRETAPLRLVSDVLERSHRALAPRSLRAELGGVLRVSLGQQTRLELPVAAPRELGEPGRWRARLRVLVLRGKRGGAPALGGNEAEAKRVVRQELAGASSLWAQCGIDLGLGSSSSIEVVDPPGSALVNLGCGVGQPASGGKLQLSVGVRRITLETHAGESPTSAALRLADALKDSAQPPRVFENQRVTNEALPTAELLLDSRAALERGVSVSSTDPTLPLCVGRVDLSDGLTHFADSDAFSGTLEERALLRGLDDGDAGSIEVLIVPAFERGERIGESFIVSPGSSLPNAVIIDRSAIAAGARSFALAHELGHVLLAMPGHPDDFGVDQSWSLMDSDVADATIFGPRRLSLSECKRALTQTGPAALAPILQPIPLTTAR